jgi:hypothetical protein
MKAGMIGAVSEVATALGALAVYAFFLWLCTPSLMGGFDRIQAWIGYVAVALPLVGFAAVHLTLAWALWSAEQRVPNPRP